MSIFAHGITPGFLFSLLSSSFADAKSEQEEKRRKKESNALMLLLLLLLLRRRLEKKSVVIVIKQTRDGNVAWVPDL